MQSTKAGQSVTGMHLKDSLRLGKDQIQYFFHEQETLLQGSFKAQSG